MKIKEDCPTKNLADSSPFSANWKFVIGALQKKTEMWKGYV